MTFDPRFPALACALFLPLGVGCASGSPITDGGTSGRPDSGMVAPTCGNGHLDPGEECEGDDFGGETCESQGYAGGMLRCYTDCAIDKTTCEEDPCGNGTLDSGEACDGMELGGATCESEGFVGGGELKCSSACALDTAQCSACGNGDVDTGEECDGTNLGAATCMSRGFTGGTLVCDSLCGLDDSGCTDATCGDGTQAGSEDCDMADLGGSACSDLGFYTGDLACNGDCTYDIGDCHNCGNGAIEGVERCDGAELAGATCMSRGFTMGTLGCTAVCEYDESGCSTAMCGNGTIETGEDCDDGNAATMDGCASCAVETGWTCTGTPSMCTETCGDSMLVGAEECDGSLLAGATCMSRGFTGGTLACTACAFDESGCTSTTCGNSTIDTGEECDDGNTVAFDGCDSACQVDSGFYLPLRLSNGEGSNHGMLEVYFGGAWRDVCDDTYDAAARDAMANVVCGQLGFTGTGHQFINAFGGGSGTPVMDDVYCTGTESTLAQCPFRGWNEENCSATETVGIRCMPAEGDIRLLDGPHGMEGRLQIYHSGAWGEVCDDYFDGAYSAYHGYSHTTVCQQLGYWSGTFVSTYDAPGDDFVVDDVNCTGTERRIGDCPHRAWGDENCSRTEGAGFRCDVFPDGGIRLVEGTGRNSGRVEVLYGDVWGTVCDDFISSAGTRQTNFISVGCTQLGFAGAGSALTTTSVPDGVDPTWMDDLDCAGTEARLAMCPFRGWGMENCSHFEDIGLTCTP